MSDTLISNPADLQDIAGLHLLGRGLNRLDWASKSKECQKVGDTASDKRAVAYKDSAYAVGKYVDFSPDTASSELSLSFCSSESYEQHVHSQLSGPGQYGALSAGFTATFGRSLDSFVNQTAALYSQSESLWKLSLAASPETGTASFRKRVEGLPDTFDSDQPEAFVDFFVDFGADVVTEVIVGGSLNYAVAAPTRYLDGRIDILRLLKSEYAALIIDLPDTPVSEEVSRHFDHRCCNLTTQGGNYSVRFDTEAPGNCHADVQAWRQSLAMAPKVISVDTSPVFRFVEPGAVRDALKQAYHWYTGHTILIDARWQDVQIRLGELEPEPVAASRPGPALRIVFVQAKSRQSSEFLYMAPMLDAAPAEFELYWASVSLLLEQKQRQGFKLLLGTERWPRDPRYFPSYRMREALLQYGARPQTLEDWEQLIQHMEPCVMAGLTYALAGNDSETRGIDGLATGFGTPGKTLNPSVRISARFAHDSFGRLKAIKRQATVLDGQTALFTLANQHGERLVLGVDPQDKTRVSLQVPEHNAPAQLWFMPQQEQRYDAIRQPTLLINHQTGACLQGHRDQSDSRLIPLGDWLEDDVLWDLRGDDQSFHLLLVYFFPDGLCLTQYDKHNAAVRQWRKDGMYWSRKLAAP